ncbi:RNA polymerase sigma factor SigI [Thalassobacillus devorans]|uniref:RNA polymerase sigma factor SigI n=1 Tax=Thalassobacillus devorans TaxID=279813 RepID=A0ABQ1PSL5_9BACI|nr:RNA polymerase sigma factor SigI [Thalassobacillus devorans]NIK30652.1 RNA polymerase sigma factor [Thalassobacillus devorans]GGD02687.1 RNA polymerase sigma factor SigI [Thalassobacillus devorans]
MIRSLFDKKTDTSLNEQVTLAQAGDEEIRNHLLQQYQPFIAKNVSEVCKRYIDQHKDDEFSIGLMAFNEAIDSFSSQKGSSFLSFARLVIKRKVIDFIRNEQRHLMAASLDEDYENEEQMENPSEITAAKEQYERQTEAWYRREEIKDFQLKLKQYKLSFKELTEVSPQHRDARESAIRVARVIYTDAELREQVLKKGRLPIKDLVGRVDVSKKTLERNRKFILAMVIILSEEYVYLKDYIKGVGL